MSLVDIKRHMMQVKMATLASLCTLFKCDAETLRCMLQHWIRKGNIRLCLKTPACGSRCFKCPTTTTELYEWVSA
jgi:putative ferrous iron transport protein C